MFEREEKELPPLEYNIGDKIMGYHMDIGGQMLVGGEIVERKQSTSYLDENKYKVILGPELCKVRKEDKELTWWIDESEVRPFKQDAWNKAVKHWLEHCELQRKAGLEYVRMHRALREEPEIIGDDGLEKS